jgi:hypothetical protein
LADTSKSHGTWQPRSALGQHPGTQDRQSRAAGDRRTAGPSRSRAKRRPEETPAEPSYQIVMAVGGNGPGRDHAGHPGGNGRASCRSHGRCTTAKCKVFARRPTAGSIGISGAPSRLLLYPVAGTDPQDSSDWRTYRCHTAAPIPKSGAGRPQHQTSCPPQRCQVT